MAQFSFAYNIADIVTFYHGRTLDGSARCTLRGTINSILIGADEAIYMIQSRYAMHPVSESDIVKPIFSTKSFDVFYPGVEVIASMKDSGKEVPAYVENAVISDGRLRYWLSTMDGLNAFQVEEGCVRLANAGPDNINNFQ
ncbi:hypothetical protein pEaSNUABM35_00141 [Erwinia phage pEa_SNUABM_35]|uniref:Uncharacterized protein n=1 Tax=Erwinia phage pEa_SNUABM_35 TaxID=2869557 RepID=A0AAE8C514_9CAUD|nr:hypothetical protein MPK65_gp141 [Erwinia phage pEa_SNUABM_35]QZE60058.1 hypothetical protein pEaSNUABM35_00141 [Erwinia phage pEa_SNUABM_35]QZE60394.1 hypothetical protein pEaSNUABM36_00141 [Erwinia phage pEa_SNUABM_36]